MSVSVSLHKVGKHDDSEIDTFNITLQGQKSLAVTQTSTKPSLLAEYVQRCEHERERDSKSMTEFDLILTLAQQGWECKCQKPSKRINPYTVDGLKVWYYHTGTTKGGMNMQYLNVLCRAHTLFAAGLDKIYHYQLNSYYRALLTVPPTELRSVLPNQPKAFYTLLIQKHSVKRGQRSRRIQPNLWDDADEGGVYIHVHIFRL